MRHKGVIQVSWFYRNLMYFGNRLVKKQNSPYQQPDSTAQVPALSMSIAARACRQTTIRVGAHTTSKTLWALSTFHQVHNSHRLCTPVLITADSTIRNAAVASVHRAIQPRPGLCRPARARSTAAAPIIPLSKGCAFWYRRRRVRHPSGSERPTLTS